MHIDAPPPSQRNLLDLLDAEVASGSSSTPLQPSKNAANNTATPTPPGQSTPFTLAAASEAMKRARLAQEFNLTQLSQGPIAPIRGIDINGEDPLVHMSNYVQRGLENDSKGWTVKKSIEYLGAQTKDDILPGMEVRLLEHQWIGVAWMVKQETETESKGGILADDMGLGKTVQMLAAMSINMPAMDAKVRVTLIVVPAALLQQWKDEVETKTNGLFRAHIHHGKDKLRSKKDMKDLDVVITSYQTLCQDFVIPKGLEDWEVEDFIEKKGGLLARTQFFRVIADEAQYIRNRSTQSSLSLAYVRAKHRWALTGTPVTNTLADIYGIIRFGHFRPWNDYPSFNNHIIKVQNEDAPLAGERAQAVLKPLIMRRTKDSQLEGQPILRLPKKDIELVKLDFTPDERQIYDDIEGQTHVRINKYIAQGTLVKNYSFVLVLILRLRQLTCHPQLILAQSGELDDPSLIVGTDAEKERSRATKLMGRPWVESVIRRFMARAQLGFGDDDPALGADCPVCHDLFTTITGRLLPCGHQICVDCLEDRMNSDIAHDGIFGEGSEKENLKAEQEYERAVAQGLRPCPTCNQMLNLKGDKIFKSAAFEPTKEEVKENKRKRREAWKTAGVRRRPDRIFSDDDDDDDSDIEIEDGPAKKSFDEMGMDDSDDDFPDLDKIIEQPVKKRKSDQGNIYASGKLVGSDDEDMDSDVDLDGLQPKKKKKKGSNMGKKRVGKGDNQAMYERWARSDDDIEPSTKMIRLLELLKEWDASGDKTIVYSQWTSMLDLVDTVFSIHGITALRFDGRMDRQQRDAVLAAFKRTGGPKVILISTKCGSVGLNLVSANRVINLDLSWNYAAESQAYDRCHRIGQDKPVWIKRLVVEDTIEERMLKLQDVKVGLAEAALGEGTGTRLHKMSVKEIKFLFGMTKPKEQQTLQQMLVQPESDDDGADSDAIEEDSD
ncbi:SNF2 family N-terminal domain-containing protein [Schizophyllum amplum]|uniref:SNF2 family N-terminal domain-containing protein n=1 Tax=Schizophyllum amplum TaxID=97359 RepID=A0A550CEJ3_9AGAR|nr:SNF2 family N-terminal domain-containing protein [Auriculariopsis ampla]